MAVATRPVIFQAAATARVIDVATSSLLTAAVTLSMLVAPLLLVAALVVVALGATAMKNLFDTSEGITRLRGQWHDFVCANGHVIPAMITFHPAFLLRTPAQKNLAWEDLKALRARLAP